MTLTTDHAELNHELEDTQHGRYLTFALGDEDFGIEIKFVTEIVGLQPITQMPDVPEYIKGIINLRGRIIPVVDVRLKFKKDPAEYTDRTCIIVIDIGELNAAGLIVDNVAEVIGIDDQNISPPPVMGVGVQNRYLMGIGKVDEKVKLLLDCRKLFSENETQDLLV
jgi:purine-binding chemotaxis protein CheW